MIRELFFHWFLFSQLRFGYFLLDLAVFNLLLTYGIVRNTSLQITLQKYMPTKSDGTCQTYLLYTLYYTYALYCKITSLYFWSTNGVFWAVLDLLPAATKQVVVQHTDQYYAYIAAQKASMRALLKPTAYPLHNVRLYFVVMQVVKDAVEYYGLDREEIGVMLDRVGSCVRGLKTMVELSMVSKKIGVDSAIDEDILKRLQESQSASTNE